MKTTIHVLAILAIALASTSSWASPYIGTGQYFVEPGSWTVGDAGSTHQAWDDVFVTSGNLPDAGYNVNPVIVTDPILNATAVVGAPIITSTKNFYSFTGNYTVDADIYNHGTAGTDGTHVIIQTAATKAASTATRFSPTVCRLSI